MRSTERPACFSVTRFTAAARGTAEGDQHSGRVARLAAGEAEPNIHSMPGDGEPIAAQVRGAIGSRSTARASSAVSSGAMLLRSGCWRWCGHERGMNATNITAHIAPERTPLARRSRAAQPRRRGRRRDEQRGEHKTRRRTGCART